MEGSHEDGMSLVRVRAQVMTRDDSTGGWVPLGAGGLSHVSVCRNSSIEETERTEYLIFGKRIADQSVILSCIIKKDFQYNKVMPTFHHWRTGDKKFGLTFQTAADARAFDKGVRAAIEDLSDGTGDFPNFHDSDLGDDDVFMALELPIDSRSSSGSSTFSGGSFRPGSGTPFQYPDMGSSTSPYMHMYHPHGNHHHLHRMNFVRSPRFPTSINPSSGNPPLGGQNYHSEEAWTKDMTVASRKDYLDSDKIELSGDLNSYVQLSRDKGAKKDHDYSYPVMDSYKSTRGEPPRKNPFDAFSSQPAPRLPVKAKKKKDWRKKDNRKTMSFARAQCRYCLETYSEADNHCGSCEYAPDPVLACIGAATCLSCAQCMLYHCMSDSEGDFGGHEHPCSCDTSDRRCPKRWTALALLSLIVPCLWCYLPCRACHRCGVRCGVCGGRHDPA
ncbi:sprouty-related, EVH1 domain-containing protein 2-like [Uloborus diversus]|uniref:sprouty-related, EVH1 domain-containing protein 2-like n=1 Tax=Uloborus diversus TaxID=327109 RepID=UPI002409A961|nr:sprouty-related, EVH1 domain-containing protein 2-like [Uloborus diversus]